MEFPGVWVNTSRTLIYRVVPKCACSTIGQILHHGDHGRFYDGDIHDAKDGIWKWNGNSDRDHARDVITDTVRDGQAKTFTCVRNPYTRILSSFFDKICGIQRNGKRYRGKLVPLLIQKYGIDVGGDDGKQEFDQIKSFRRFLLFARDTIRWRRPMDPDIHWSAMSGHVSTFIVNGGRYDQIFWTETFNDGMQKVLDSVETPQTVDISAIPRFNESEGHGPKRAHPVEDYFDDLAAHIVTDIYRKDFAVFKYSKDPGRGGPTQPLDAEEINAALKR